MYIKIGNNDIFIREFNKNYATVEYNHLIMK